MNSGIRYFVSDDRGQKTEDRCEHACSFCRLSSDFCRLEVGFPIRKSAAQSLFAAPRGLSQRTTSFIACAYQGIHRTPLRHLIALIIDARAFRSPAARERNGGILEDPNHLGDGSDPAHMPRPAYGLQPRRRAGAMAGKTSVTRELPVGEAVKLHQLSLVHAKARTSGQLFSSRCQRTGSTPHGHAANQSILDKHSLAFERLVEPDGIEPTTSCLQSRRSPN